MVVDIGKDLARNRRVRVRRPTRYTHLDRASGVCAFLYSGLGVRLAARRFRAVYRAGGVWLGRGRRRCRRAVLSTEPSVSLGVERSEWERMFHVSRTPHVGLPSGSR
jgi:hypothetical protein